LPRAPGKKAEIYWGNETGVQNEANRVPKDVTPGTYAGTESDLKHKTQTFMKMLAKRPHRVKNYFHHPMVAYVR
jgi:hypothetical protein